MATSDMVRTPDSDDLHSDHRDDSDVAAPERQESVVAHRSSEQRESSPPARRVMIASSEDDVERRRSVGKLRFGAPDDMPPKPPRPVRDMNVPPPPPPAKSIRGTELETQIDEFITSKDLSARAAGVLRSAPLKIQEDVLTSSWGSWIRNISAAVVAHIGKASRRKVHLQDDGAAKSSACLDDIPVPPPAVRPDSQRRADSKSAKTLTGASARSRSRSRSYSQSRSRSRSISRDATSQQKPATWPPAPPPPAPVALSSKRPPTPPRPVVPRRSQSRSPQRRSRSSSPCQTDAGHHRSRSRSHRQCSRSRSASAAPCRDRSHSRERSVSPSRGRSKSRSCSHSRGRSCGGSRGRSLSRGRSPSSNHSRGGRSASQQSRSGSQPRLTGQMKDGGKGLCKGKAIPQYRFIIPEDTTLGDVLVPPICGTDVMQLPGGTKVSFILQRKGKNLRCKDVRSIGPVNWDSDSWQGSHGKGHGSGDDERRPKSSGGDGGAMPPPPPPPVRVRRSGSQGAKHSRSRSRHSSRSISRSPPRDSPPRRLSPQPPRSFPSQRLSPPRESSPPPKKSAKRVPRYDDVPDLPPLPPVVRAPKRPAKNDSCRTLPPPPPPAAGGFSAASGCVLEVNNVPDDVDEDYLLDMFNPVLENLPAYKKGDSKPIQRASSQGHGRMLFMVQNKALAESAVRILNGLDLFSHELKVRHVVPD